MYILILPTGAMIFFLLNKIFFTSYENKKNTADRIFWHPVCVLQGSSTKLPNGCWVTIRWRNERTYGKYFTITTTIINTMPLPLLVWMGLQDWNINFKRRQLILELTLSRLWIFTMEALFILMVLLV